MNEELMKQTQDGDFEIVAADFLTDLLGAFWDYFFSPGEDVKLVTDAYNIMTIFNKSQKKNTKDLDESIRLLDQVRRTNVNKKFLWARRDMGLAYCYGCQGEYEKCFSSIKNVIDIEITTLTEGKDEIQKLKGLAYSLGFELYQEIVQNLNSEKAQLDQAVKQLKSENTKLDQEVKQLESKNAELEEKLRQLPSGTINKTLLIVMCILSSLAIIISLVLAFDVFK